MFAVVRSPEHVRSIVESFNGDAQRAGFSARVCVSTIKRGGGAITNTHLSLVTPVRRLKLSLGNDKPATVKAAIAHLLQAQGISAPFEF